LNSTSSPIANLDEIGSGLDNSIDEILSLKEGENKWVTFTFEFGESKKEDVIKDIQSFTLNSKIDFIEKSTPEAIIDVEENKDDLDKNLKAAEKATELMERQVKMMDKVDKMSKEK
jgi:folate-binding Fe-S cluster repair protein YgfZ